MDKYKDLAQQGQGMMQSSAGMDDAAELMKMSERYNKLAQSGVERKGKIKFRQETGRADVGAARSTSSRWISSPTTAAATRPPCSSSSTRKTSRTSPRARN